MNIVNITLGVDTQPCSSITLGRRGENEVTQVVVDFSSWAEEFGAGVITLLAMRSRDSSAYPIVLTLDGSTATWDVTSTDTAYKGSGRAEYIYTVGEQIAKSVVFNTVVLQDIGEPSETPPDPYEEWLERLTELGAETQANAEAAQQSAEDAAESAEDAAQSATSVEDAVEQAEAARDAARAAQTASESARDAAQTAQTSAEASATAASGSATAAAGYASDASQSASSASASASDAGASATTASTAATAAQTAQSAAEDAAEDAQQAAQQAHVEYEQLSGEVDDLSDEVAQQKSAIEALDALVDRKAGALVDTTSGVIASFVPDATIDNLLGVSVDIEPVQDLHGYDAPWPAGGGKNKLRPLTVDDFDGAETYGLSTYIHLPFAAGTYTVSTDAPTGYIWAGKNLVNPNYQRVFSGTPLTITPNDGDTEILLGILTTDKATALSYKIQIEVGSTASAWSPYENLCPISGWDAVEVERTGVNLFDEVLELGNIRGDNGENAGGNTTLRSANYIRVTPNATYYITVQNTRIFQYGKEKQYTGVYAQYTRNTFTVGSNCYYIRIRLDESYGTTYNNDISINYPATDHAYHPFAGNRYTIQLGQTVYGGTLTISEDGSVKALVDRAKIVFDGTQPVGIANWRVNAQSAAWLYRAETVFGIMLEGAHIISDTLPPVDYQTMWNATSSCISNVPGDLWALAMRVNDTTLTTETAINAYLAEHPIEVVYELATPIVIGLDPVQIATIAGQQNNVWANTGDVSVEYAADLKHYIDRLNQPTEDDMIANSLIASGKYFTVNNRLFLSTASIAAGAQIIPGTNCTETSLAAALNALNA